MHIHIKKVKRRSNHLSVVPKMEKLRDVGYELYP